MIVHLSEWEYRRGFEVGIARFTANWSRSDAAHYQSGGLEPRSVELLGWVLADEAYPHLLWRIAGQYGHYPSHLLKKPLL